MIFSVRQLQEKCREQRQPLYLALVDLTRAFDLVSRDGIFKLLQRIDCPLILHSIISFHSDMRDTVSFDGFRQFACQDQITHVLIRKMLFGDDAALVSHTNDGLQRLIDQFAHACKEFALTISIKKTDVMAQDATSPPTIVISDFRLATVDNFRHLDI
ncbi:hypothetical protein HOLleu_16364 [Holothuria leucospilota]|uniref:Reverse transcriptase domain-containing protein n=1 Tax=Holothuria leucospilota TaxID=206669 RepID=A0A9Q1C677_HOLLE|nr:hypothetical protein HOLleu_16364 [Holothuria leucospilota]